MFEAIVAGLIAALIVIAIVVVIAIIRNNRAANHVAQKKDIQQFDTVGVGTTPFDNPSAALSAKNGEVHVVRDQATVKKPADNLHPRFLAIGVLATAIFGSLAAKLWSLQVLSNSAYAQEAEQNLFTTVSTPAPRGSIMDTNGIPLATNRTSQTVLAESTVADDRDIVRRLSAVIGVPANVVRQRILNTTGGAQSQRVVAADASLRDIAFISEHADAFPGITVESRTVREYPYGALAAHVLGYTGAPTDTQLGTVVEGREILATDTVGHSGVEATYDKLISGDHGQRRMKVDANGNIMEVVSETRPGKGSDIRLTIDARVQYLADSRLAKLIAPDGVIGKGVGVAGAIVAMNVKDGSILAMASYPTFDPNNFTGGISNEIWDLYDRTEAWAPLNNRALNGQYAAASTYKAFTSLAGLEYGFANKDTKWECGGRWDGFNTGDVQMCWNHNGHGQLDLRGGIVNSCDVVFYEIGKAFWEHGPQGSGEVSETALQEFLEKFRFGQATGIDLANESTGRIPTPAWRAEYFRNRPAEAQWRGGDYSNTVIGQGDVLVTPLQIAVAYGAVATGKIVKPHLLKEVYNASGEVVVSAEPEIIGDLDVNTEHLNYVRDSLHGVINDNSDSYRVFASRNLLNAAGKSGTAEHTNTNDDAWYVCYAPYDDPTYVVVTIIEQGGGGTDVAAPITADIMEAVLKAQRNGDDMEIGHVAGSTGESVEYKGSGSGRTD